MKKLKLPPSLIIVYMFLLFVALLTWVVPVSVVTVSDDGVKEVHYNASLDDDGNIIEDYGTEPAGIWDVMLAPVQGLQAGSDVIAVLLIAGGFLSLLSKTGAMEAGIGVLVNKYTGSTLLVLLMLAFSAMGTMAGLFEELTVYALVIIPLVVMAGYDVMTAFLVMFIGVTIGNMSSIVNPFSTGAAIAAINNENLSMGNGIILRMVLFVALQILGTFLVLRYANAVKKDPSKSVLADLDDVETLVSKEGALPEMNKQRAWSLGIYIACIVASVIGYVPWYNINLANGNTMYDVVNAPQNWLMDTLPALGNFIGADAFTPWGDWYFDEYSTIFLLGAVLMLFINKMTIDEWTSAFIDGAKDLLGVSLVLSVAKGLSILMGSRSYGMSVTFVYWIQGGLSGIPSWAFVIGTVLAFCAIGLFLQSTSGVAGITMPILGAATAALFATTQIGEVGGQVMLISAFTLGLNFMSGGYPGATVMGTLDLANIPYPKYLKMYLKMAIPLLILGTIIITLAPFLGLAS